MDQYLDSIYKIEQNRFLWQDSLIHLQIKKLLSRNASQTPIKMYTSIVRAESLVVQNIYLGDIKPYSPLNAIEIIRLYKGVIPKSRISDEGNLHFAISTLEQAIKTKPYTNFPIKGLEYNFLFAQASTISSFIRILSGDINRAYDILKNLDFDISLDKSDKCIGGQLLISLGLYIRGLCLLYNNKLSEARENLEKCLNILHIFIEKANQAETDTLCCKTEAQNIKTEDAYGFRLEVLLNSTSYFLVLTDTQLILNAICQLQNDSHYLDTFETTFKFLVRADRRRSDEKWKLLVLKKVMLIKSYLYISLDLKPGSIKPLSGIIDFQKDIECQYEPEFIGFTLYTLEKYEKYTTSLYPSPTASRNEEEDYLYSLILDCYNLYAYVLTLSLPGEDVYTGISRYRKLMDLFYRGSGHTVYHLPLYRIFVNSVGAICHLDIDMATQQEIQEAIKAADLYLCVWSEEFCMVADKLGKTSLEQEINKGGKEAGMRRYSAISQRRVSSKVDTSLANISAYARDLIQHMDALSKDEKCQSDNKFTADCSSSCKSYSSSDSENFHIKSHYISSRSEATVKLRKFVVEKVKTESHEDIIGVLISAANIILLNYCGDSEEIDKAVHFSEFALAIYEFQISRLSRKNVANTEFYVRKMLGLSYGEYALEVSDTTKRDMYQKLAINLLQRAVSLKSNCWSTKFQLSLQLSESGKIVRATEVLKSCLTLKPPTPTPWNLMAILLSISRDFEKAIFSCELGIRECVKIYLKVRGQQVTTPSQHSIRSEDSTFVNKYTNVDPIIREDIFCTLLTKFVLEIPRIPPGPQVLEHLEKIFSSFKDLFGANLTYCRSCDSSDISRRATGSKSSIIANDNDYSIPLNARPRVVMYYIHIWIISSMMYRYLGYYEEAWNSVNSAKKVLVDLKELASRNASEAETAVTSTSSQFSRNVSTNSNPQYNSGMLKRLVGQCKSDSSSIISKITKHLFADITFETCLIKCCSFSELVESVLLSQLSSANISQYSSSECEDTIGDDLLRGAMLSWLSTIGPQDQERSPEELNQSRRGTCDLFRSFSEDGPTRKLKLKNLPIKQRTRGSSELQNPLSYDIDTKKDLNLNAAKNNFSNDTRTSPLLLSEDAESIDEIIGKLQEVILFNRYHIGAHVMLGVLYYFREKYDISLKYLLQVCHAEKGRGSEFGRNGITSFAGGVSGGWQQVAWRFLSKCLLKKGSVEVSKTAIIRAIKEKKASRVRCMESLRRLF